MKKIIYLVGILFFGSCSAPQAEEKPIAQPEDEIKIGSYVYAEYNYSERRRTLHLDKNCKEIGDGVVIVDIDKEESEFEDIMRDYTYMCKSCVSDAEYSELRKIEKEIRKEKYGHE